MKMIIELEDVYVNQNAASVGPQRLYRVKGFNTLVFDEEGLKKLRELNKDTIREIQEEAFRNGRESALRDLQELITCGVNYQKNQEKCHDPESDVHCDCKCQREHTVDGKPEDEYYLHFSEFLGDDAFDDFVRFLW